MRIAARVAAVELVSERRATLLVDVTSDVVTPLDVQVSAVFTPADILSSVTVTSAHRTIAAGASALFVVHLDGGAAGTGSVQITATADGSLVTTHVPVTVHAASYSLTPDNLFPVLTGDEPTDVHFVATGPPGDVVRLDALLAPGRRVPGQKFPMQLLVAQPSQRLDAPAASTEVGSARFTVSVTAGQSTVPFYGILTDTSGNELTHSEVLQPYLRLPAWQDDLPS